VQHWYVYYKLPRSERAGFVARVREMQQSLAQGNPVRVRLLERCEDGSETTTVMEVYEDIREPARFAAALNDAVRASGLDAGLAGVRRIERFQDT
jgi:uncharacterized protein DUF4936